MNLSKAAIPAIILFLTTISASAQADEGKFAITRGSTFSASGSVSEKRTITPNAPAIMTISSDMEELFNIVRNNHASGNKLRSDKLIGSAITSMLEQLDPHSNYFSPEEFQELNDGHRGQYVGIGTTIADVEYDGASETFVLAVKPNSPAERAGFRFGDRIIGVDGKAAFGLLEVRNMVRGPIGTITKMTVERADGSIVREIPIKRDRVVERSVSTALLLDTATGYISLTNGFDYSTCTEFDAAFRTLKSQGMRSLIIDLRGNGGGLMDQAILIAEKFLPFGQGIVSQRGRYAAEDREWRSRNRRPETLPIVLLVDEGSASASEILAAAMQDNDRATIVGERTFGKGLVQNVIPLEDGSGLTLTSERYFTPAGRTLQREYSDSGLYDYFRHTNQGVLIDKPELAVKTRSGRTVFGGDGVKPDETVNGFETTSKRSALVDRMFNAIRKGQDLTSDESLLKFCIASNPGLKCSDDLAYLRVNAAQLNSLKFANENRFAIDALRFDPQVDAAIRSLSRTTSKKQ